MICSLSIHMVVYQSTGDVTVKVFMLNYSKTNLNIRIVFVYYSFLVYKYQSLKSLPFFICNFNIMNIVFKCKIEFFLFLPPSYCTIFNLSTERLYFPSCFCQPQNIRNFYCIYYQLIRGGLRLPDNFPGIYENM